MAEGMLAGKTALVTGGASGIGRATCEAFARENARVLVCDVDEAGGKDSVAAIAAAGGEARFLRVDVTVESDVETAVRSVVDSWGRLDCAVNNAGVTGAGGPVGRLSADEWSRVIGINLTGVFLCMTHELRAMQAQGSGAIVNVASGAGVIAVPAMPHYCASKHGVLGLTKTAAVENARSRVRVNAICPGSTDTPTLRATMQASPEVEKLVMRSLPGGRLGLPAEIAEAAVWLCSDRASFVNGESMLVDGGAVAR